MRLRLSLFGIFSLLSTSWALSQSQAGVVDWQKTFVGTPHVDAPARRPVFHRLAGGKGTRSFLITATKSNVLAAIDPASGDVAWRQLYEEDDPIVSFQPNQDGLVVLSGTGGANVRLYEVATGNIIWETQLHAIKDGLLMEPPTIGVGLAFAKDKSPDVFVLSNVQTVYRLDGLTGKVKWVWQAQDQTSLILFSKVVATQSTVYLVGLAKSFATFTVHIATLDQLTGIELASQDVPSSIQDPMDPILVLTSGVDPLPRLVWHEKDNIRSVALPSDMKIKSPIFNKDFAKIVDVGLEAHGYLVALKSDGTAFAYKQDGTGKGLRQTWEFEDTKKTGMYSESVFSGGFDKHGLPYISMTHWSHLLKSCSSHLYAPHGADGQGMITGFSWSYDTANHGVLLYGALDVANPKDYTYVARIAFMTSSGGIQLWHQDQHQWTREESLADIRAVEFLDLPERLIAASHSVDQPEGFFERLLRHQGELQNLPAYILQFTRRFISGTSPTSSSPTDLWRDAFGFKKLIIAATSTGKVFAIETTRGHIVWSKILSISDTTGAPSFADMRLFVIKGVQDDDGQKPQVALVTMSTNVKSGAETVVYHLDALTGKTIGKDHLKGISSPQYSYTGTFVDAYLVQGTQKSVAIVDQDNKIHIFPPSTIPSFAEIAPRIHFSVVEGSSGYRQLQGYKVLVPPALQQDGSNTTFSTMNLWTTNLPLGQDVKSIVKPTRGPVASYGKVLGDRSTLYKYLNPHLIAVITGSSTAMHLLPGSKSECGIYLVDSVKGSIVYHASLYTVTRACEIQATLVDNWLVYYYYEDDVSSAPATAKGHRMVTVELYEGANADEKTASSDLSGFSSDSVKVSVVQQSFVYPHGVTALSSTSTKFGISMKDIIVATDKNQIQSIPRRMLDPRRPKRKPTAQEQEEGLVPFDPVLSDDARRILSHKLETTRIRKIWTSPTQLESTSIVFAHGLDLFLTRVAPSNTFDLLSEDFNRLQLVLTFSGLALAILITKPLVRARALKAQWYT